MISAATIAAQAGATAQDIAAVAARHPVWFRTINGQVFVTEEHAAYAEGALYAVVENRRDARIATAVTALGAAHDALRAHPRTPRAPRGQAEWQSTALRLFAEVTAALVELLDAKVDARVMSPDRADRIRTEALGIQRAAETSAGQAMRRALRLGA